MSAALVEGDYEDTVYGAVSFREADPTTGAFDYTVHVRLRSATNVCCCTHKQQTARTNQVLTNRTM